jgi:acetyltransferase-like isoleucine patch superfamily enzyme
VGWLNGMPGIQIAPSAWIASSARLQTASDGHALGGRIRLSDRVTISDGVLLAAYGGCIDIDTDAYVGPYCVLYGHGGLSIGRDTMIGAHTAIIPFDHGFERTEVPMRLQPLTRKGVTIGVDVWIGARCAILDGVSIERGAVVGAGSVVTRDIGAYCVAVGVPARVVRRRELSARSAPEQAAEPPQPAPPRGDPAELP